MNKDTLFFARKDAERFLEKVKILEIKIKNEKSGYLNFPMEQGAVKRSSMDLTRSLANLRRSG